MGELKTLDIDGSKLQVYEAQPEGDCKGGLIVIHEVWGLADHIKDVADRFAKEGYYVVAPELLAGIIDIEAARMLQNDLFNPEKRNEAQPKLRALMTPMQNPEFGAKTLASIRHLFDYLYNMPEIKNKVGVVGYCFGGTYSFSLAVNEPRLKLAMPYYGHADFTVDQLKQIACPVRAFYGQNDEGLIGSLDELKSKMTEAGVNFAATVYPNCGHAFFNDTNPYAYNQEAATDAWQKSLNYLKEFLV